MRRKTLVGLALALLATILLLAAVVELVERRGERRLAAAVTRFQQEIGDLDPAAHAPAEPPPAENAAARFRAGAAVLALSEDQRAALGASLQRDWTAAAEIDPAVAEILRRNSRALAEFRRAGELHRSSYGIDYAAGPDGLLDDLPQVLRIRRILAADARGGLATGDRERVLADARAIAALRRSLEREPALVCQLLARAVATGYHGLVHDALASDLADPALLAELAALLDQGEATRALAAAFAVEASWMSRANLWQEAGWRGFLWRLRSPFEQAAMVDLHRRLARAAELPAAEMAAFVRGDIPGDPVTAILADMLIPNLMDGLDKHSAAAAERRLAAAAIALRRHALEHGAYPEDLGGIPGAELGDPYGGGRLRYDRRADGSAVLSLPAAQTRWRERHPQPIHHAPRFSWRLPAAPAS